MSMIEVKTADPVVVVRKPEQLVVVRLIGGRFDWLPVAIGAVIGGMAGIMIYTALVQGGAA